MGDKTLLTMVISFGFTFLIALIVAFILTPKRGGRIRMSTNNELEGNVSKLVKMFGGDILAIVPKDIVTKNTRSTKIEKLFRDSGNPWGITIHEFFIVKIILGALGLLFGSIIAGFLNYLGMQFIGLLFLPVFTMVMYFYPNSYYESSAKIRISKFKYELPEAIDYLLMAITGNGSVLSKAIDDVLEYMDDGVMKNEFLLISSDLQSGIPMKQALQNFADRSPTEGIKAFSKALNNAFQNGTEMESILKNRANASRRDLEAEIERRVAKLSSIVSAILMPATAFPIMIISAAPSIHFMTQVF